MGFSDIQTLETMLREAREQYLIDNGWEFSDCGYAKRWVLIAPWAPKSNRRLEGDLENAVAAQARIDGFLPGLGNTRLTRPAQSDSLPG